MTVLAILQARVSSSRLPGKVLKPVLGVAMLARQIERVRRAERIEQLVVATSVDAADDAIAALGADLGVPCHRGPLDDVLTRFILAARPYAPTHIVRLTGDCPLADPALIDQVITHHLATAADYTSNTLPPTYPDGLDVEVVRMAALEVAAAEATRPAEREHVTLFIHQRPERFRLAAVRGDTDLSHLRWTVDEPADFELVTAIYRALYPANPAFITADIMAWLAANPAWLTHNTDHRRNEGLAKSLAADEEKSDV